MYTICQLRNYNILKIYAFAMVTATYFCRVKGCHTTTLNIQNGTWCDPGDPNFGKTKDPGVKFPTPTPDHQTLEPPPVPPVSFGCKCGALDEESMEGVKHGKTFGRELNRPWVVHIKTNKLNEHPNECGGTLLNKRWIISSAHCFCRAVGNCKPIGGEQIAYFNYNRTTNIDGFNKFNRVYAFEFGTQGHKPAANLSIEEVLIHPLYEEGHVGVRLVIGSVNVALIRMDGDIFNEEETGYLTGGTVQPICLPGHFHHVSDVDCEVSRYMDSIKCQYDEKEKSTTGKKTHITSWGWTTSTESMDRELNYTNNFGPRRDLYGKCLRNNKCNKAIVQAYTVYLRYNNNASLGWWPNPSQAEPVCNNFVESTSYQAALQKQRDIKDEKLVSLADTNFLGYVLIQTNDRGNITCYPHKLDDALWDATSMMDHPFRHGWCRIRNPPDPDIPTPQGVNINDHHPSPDAGWGWCDHSNEQPHNQTNYHTRIKEAVVDSFSHEHCDGRNYHNGHRATKHAEYEFCTGYPTVHTYAQLWKLNSDDTYTFVEHIYRDVRTDLQNPGGKKYKHRIPVITPASGDVCMGDTGSTVWKMKHLSGKPYAFLTGIAGRNEKTCGRSTMRWDQFIYPVHTKLKSILDTWIHPKLRNSPGTCTGTQ